MNKKLTLNRRTIKNLKLKLNAAEDHKAAPPDTMFDPSNGSSC